MEIASKYMKVFASDGLTRQKYGELHGLAVSIRERKNAISKEIASDLLKYLGYSPLVFVTEMRAKYKGVINSNFDKQLYQDVMDAYQNKFDAIIGKISFSKVEFKGFEFYKRNCKGHSKGDLKRVITKHSSTPLSICLTYLARYGNDGTLAYIGKQLESCDGKKREFYNSIIRCCDKFGFGRLMALALQRRERVISKYKDKPIEFKSLSFRGRSRKKLIVGYNKN